MDKIVPYEFNNKYHNEQQVDRIANSIREFGFINPVVIDKYNIIIAGHGRVAAAKKLGLTAVPCIRAEELTDEQVKKFRILDNKLNESERNFENLKIELDSLPNFDFGELEMSAAALFPELDVPDYNPEDYDDDFANVEMDKGASDFLLEELTVRLEKQEFYDLVEILNKTKIKDKSEAILFIAKQYDDAVKQCLIEGKTTVPENDFDADSLIPEDIDELQEAEQI